MGLERIVRFPSGSMPDWERVAEKLEEFGTTPVLRMIDGQLAFPDERPEADWSELRVGLPGGMVTLRKQGDRVHCLIWGNADAEMLRGRERCAWALATVGNGQVVGDDGTPIDLVRFRTDFEVGD